MKSPTEVKREIIGADVKISACNIEREGAAIFVYSNSITVPSILSEQTLTSITGHLIASLNKVEPFAFYIS